MPPSKRILTQSRWSELFAAWEKGEETNKAAARHFSAGMPLLRSEAARSIAPISLADADIAATIVATRTCFLRCFRIQASIARGSIAATILATKVSPYRPGLTS
jgi:hypothetical protein